MSRLIDAKELEESKWADLDTAWGRGWNAAIDAILEAAPAVDAVPVVRCKDCIHWSYEYEECIYHDFEDHPYGYCAWGERREDD